MDSQAVINILTHSGVLPIVRLPDLAPVPQLAEVLLVSGVTAFELTLTCPDALPWLARLRAETPAFQQERAVIGMGSVITPTDAAAAIEAGAQFIVTPVTNPATIAACVKRGVPIIPGALTPTEIQTAWEAGASIVKVFPAHHFGPVYLKDLLAPLPHLKLLPTGGVTPENTADYIRHGAVAVGVGSNLVNPRWVAEGDWFQIGAAAVKFVHAVRAARAAR